VIDELHSELGRPHEIARQFADEIGTSRSRTASFRPTRSTERCAASSTASPA
jgi:hypothetical protein